MSGHSQKLAVMHIHARQGGLSDCLNLALPKCEAVAGTHCLDARAESPVWTAGAEDGYRSRCGQTRRGVAGDGRLEEIRHPAAMIN